MSVTTLALEGAALTPAPGIPGDLRVHPGPQTGATRTAPRKALPLSVGQALDTTSALLVLFAVYTATELSRIPQALEAVLSQSVSVRTALLVGGFTFLWPRLLALGGLYEAGPPRRRDEVLRVAVVCTVGSFLAWIFPLAFMMEAFDPRAALYFWIGSVAATLAVRVPLWTWETHARAWAPPKRILIVGSGPRALRLSRDIQESPERTYELIGFVDSNDHELSEDMDVAKLGTLEQLEEILMHRVVDEVMIALPIKSCYAEIQQAIQVCERVGVESKYLADAFRCSLARPRFEQHSDAPVVSLKVVQDDHRVLLKRIFDFTAALMGLIVLSPVMLAIALAVKLDSKGPVIFAQERYGRNKRRFKMLKFRTMVPNAEALQARLEDQNEAIGPVFKIKDDPRITKVGKFLRKTSLDELPQLVNVLLGHMSLVGPRPLPVRDVQLFDQAWFMRRFSVAPGVTGLWQISGRSNLGFDDWVTLDLKYIDDWSLVLDLKILAKTVPAVVRGVGAA